MTADDYEIINVPTTEPTTSGYLRAMDFLVVSAPIVFVISLIYLIINLRKRNALFWIVFVMFSLATLVLLAVLIGGLIFAFGVASFWAGN